jgi:hypothetical protein
MQSVTRDAVTNNTKQVIVAVHMLKEDAERTEWEMRYGPDIGLRAPMGELLQRGIMDLGNLGYISEKARDPKQRLAARTLLAHKLGQPQTSEAMARHGPEVKGTGEYLEDKYYEHLMLAMVYAIVGILVGIYTVGALLWNATGLMLQGEPWVRVVLVVALGLFVLVLPAGLWIRHKVIKEIRHARNFNVGREGEEWVLDRLRAKLDNQWTVFRAVALPGKGGDSDIVLVGPAGIHVLEVKAYRTPLRAIAGRWEVKSKKGWETLNPNPRQQGNRNAMNLKAYLASHGVVRDFIPAHVVLTQPHPITDFDANDPHVWFQFQLDEKLTELNSTVSPVPLEQLQSTIQLLSKEVDKESKK